jgi:hypothetical protein
MLARLASEPGVKLATHNPGSVRMPHWALAGIPLLGDRTARRIFRLPVAGGAWAQRWLYSHPDGFDCASPDAIVNAITQSTTIWRRFVDAHKAAGGEDELDVSGGDAGAIKGEAEAEATFRATISSHWFLVPYGAINGVILGFGMMHMMHDTLDRNISVVALRDLSSRFGRFIMDEATGEFFFTAFREDNTVLVAWAASVRSCERVREMMLFATPEVDGTQPTQVLLRNSFYDRRDCRMCTTPDAHSVLALRPPCSGIAMHRHCIRNEGDGNSWVDNSWEGFHSSDTRYNGRYWGTVEKRQYDRATRVNIRSEQALLLIDIRNGTASVARMLRDNVKQSALSFGLGPRSSTRVFLVNQIAALAAFESSVALCDSAEPPPSHSLSVTKEAASFRCCTEGEFQATATPFSLAVARAVAKRPRVGVRSISGCATSGSSKQSLGEVEASLAGSSDIDRSDKSSADRLDDVRGVRTADPIEREFVLHQRRMRNRASAAKSNALRKDRLERESAELARLKVIVPALLSRREALVEANAVLKAQIADPQHAQTAPIVEPSLIQSTCESLLVQREALGGFPPPSHLAGDAEEGPTSPLRFLDKLTQS